MHACELHAWILSSIGPFCHSKLSGVLSVYEKLAFKSTLRYIIDMKCTVK